MTDAAWSSRRLHSRGRLAVGVGLLVAVLALTLGVSTMAWGDGLREQQRLLPGTTVAGVDVGDETIDAAVVAVQEEIAADLDREVEVVHGDRSWTTSPRRLGATSDAEQVVAAAFEHTSSAGLVDLARHRFTGGHHGDHEIALDVPADAVTSFVAGIAGDVDTDPRDAEVTWADDRADVQESVTGVRVQQQAAADALQEAVTEGATTVELPVEEDTPTFGTDAARRLADEVDRLVTDALDHEVTVTLEDTRRTVTPRHLDAAHNAEELLAAGEAAVGDVELQIPDGALAEVVDEVEAGHERAARDASLAWSPSGGFAATPGQTGLAVDDEAARAALHEALQGERDRVELELHTTQPSLTTDRFDRVLLVRQGDRRVELYEGGEVVRSWSVAVGTGDHPTPTGMFTIGARRYEPTWYNPSPDSWGNDMPAKIGPGPTNPLGLRALNWMSDGRDTLIRFHGTANEDSIGEAASHGCVRMRNPDVIELYDLVPRGTVIVSVDQ